MIENLTKENFWNEMQQKYPKVMKKFLDWIDKYKEDNLWNLLFNADIIYDQAGVEGRRLQTKAPKYHELPLAFQVGLFDEFTNIQDIDEETLFHVVRNDIEDTLDTIEDNFKTGVYKEE